MKFVIIGCDTEYEKLCLYFGIQMKVQSHLSNHKNLIRYHFSLMLLKWAKCALVKNGGRDFALKSIM